MINVNQGAVGRPFIPGEIKATIGTLTIGAVSLYGLPLHQAHSSLSEFTTAQEALIHRWLDYVEKIQ